MLVTLIFVGTLILLALIRYHRLNNYVKDVALIPFNLSAFFKFGRGNMHEVITGISNSYERIGKAWVGPLLTIFIDHPDDLRTILNSRNCLDRSYVYRLIPSGDGLFTANEHVWKYSRKYFKHAFTIRSLRSFVPVFNAEANKLINKLDKKVGAPTFDIFEYLYTFNGESLFITAMNVQTDLFNAEYYVAKMIKSIQRILEISSQRFQNVHLHPEFIFKISSKYREQKKIIKDMIELFEQVQNVCLNGSNNYSTDIQDHFIFKKIIELKQTGRMTQKTFQDHINTFMVAGTETTAITVSAILMMLAIHPDIQEKAYNEIVHECGPDATYFDTNLISKLSYIECIIKESMRLFPIASVLARVTAADVKLNTHTIPKGTNLVMIIDKTHRNPTFWGTNANQFDPERFSTENSDNRHPYAFLPFSSGPKNCIGYKYAMISMKIQLSFLLTHFKFVTAVKMSDIHINMTVTSKFANGYKLQIEHRKPAQTE